MASIRVEARPIGCSLLIGDVEEARKILESSARVRLPPGVSSGHLDKMLPFLDAFPETRFVTLMDADGIVRDFRRLISTRPRYTEGVELLRLVTTKAKTIGFVLRRGRSAISVYWAGRLEAVGELSERSGLWEFSRPMEGIDQVTQRIPGIGNLLVRIVEVGRDLVARGHGGLFIVGDATGLRTTPPKVQLEPQLIEDLSVDDVVELAKLDGAVMLSADGYLREATVIIQNRSDGNAARSESSNPGHGGSRQEAARRTSLECPNCAAVYISQNGAIEVYIQGEGLPIAEAISGVGGRAGG
jgi:hypothetical protein